MQGIFVNVNALFDQLHLSIQSAAAVEAPGNSKIKKNIFGFKFIMRKIRHEGSVKSQTALISHLSAIV